MQEWLNWPAWKASKRQKRFRGSNPLLSAKETDRRTVAFHATVFCFERKSGIYSQTFAQNKKQRFGYRMFASLFPLHGRRRQAGDHGTKAQRVP